jgi:peroxiredoxin
MSAQTNCLRLADLPVSPIGGGTANLAGFCGQKLVVYFCADTDSEEVAAFAGLMNAFERAGAWVIGLRPSERAAFEMLASHFPDMTAARPEDGATFVIDRDGIPRHFWAGCGHARAALEATRERP